MQSLEHGWSGRALAPLERWCGVVEKDAGRVLAGPTLPLPVWACTSHLTSLCPASSSAKCRTETDGVEPGGW